MVVGILSARRREEPGMMNGVRVGHDSLSINVLELFGTVWTAFAMIVIKKESPE